VSAPAFTSGPWQRKSDYEPTVIIGNVDGEIHPDGSASYSYDFIANLEDEYGGSPANAYANAALILAAPELYKAADRARILIGAANDDLPEAVRESRINEAWHLLDDALKLARGQA
jgi:hypothetical protein